MDEDEDIIDSPEDFNEEPENIEIESGESDDDNGDIQNTEDNIIENIEDINVFNKNYSKFKKDNKTSPVLSKYEKTKILSKRCEQLESGCLVLIKDYEKYDNIYDIALEELNQKKIPFILKRFINGKYEYWKLEDLIY
jgi:DNA-directed RNA polymerase subunit K/omega